MIAPVKRVVTMTGPQASVCIALEPVLARMHVRLACPRCIADYRKDTWVEGYNAQGDAVYKLICPCTERIISPASVVSLTPAPDMLADFTGLLQTVDVDIRCPNPICRPYPMSHLMLPDGRLESRCQCRARRGVLGVPAGVVH